VKQTLTAMIPQHTCRSGKKQRDREARWLQTLCTDVVIGEEAGDNSSCCKTRVVGDGVEV
jgi:hypothetical protein